MWACMHEISQVISSKFGALLAVDYGDATAFTNTLRGIKGHYFVRENEMLRFPGEVDLSVNVNFADLAEIVEKYKDLIVHGMMRQGDFLEAMGVKQRVDMLSKLNPVKGPRALKAQYERLCREDKMGKVYKVLMVAHKIYGRDVYPFVAETEDKPEFR